jgi:putative Mn2+ efflux pump MntP
MRSGDKITSIQAVLSGTLNFVFNNYKKKSEIAGGIILILIGVKILLEHLGIISF